MNHRAGRLLLRLVLLLMLPVLLTAAGAEEGKGGAEETVIGYFRENKLIRPRPEAGRDYIGSVPAYTVVELKTVKKNWGTYTSPEGTEGYVFYGDIQPLPQPEPCGERIVYCGERHILRSLPETGQQDPRRVEAGEILTADGVLGEFAHVRTSGDEEGYILQHLLLEADFEPEPISPVRFCAGVETGALSLPLKGAQQLMTVSPGRVYEAAEGCGEYYVLRTAEGAPAYVWKGNVRLWQAVNADSMDFFRKPGVRGSRGDEAPEEIYTRGFTGKDTTLWYGDGRQEVLPADTRVYVYAAYGGFCGISRGQAFGYVLKEDLDIRTRAEAVAAIAETDLSGASLERNIFLDQAMSLLEEGNSFLLRYNAITGADIQPLFSLGIPYFWGGRSYNVMTERYPEYTTRAAWQSSLNYYKKDTVYLYGLDCTGLVKQVYRMAGHAIQGTVTELGDAAVCRAGHHIWCSAEKPIPEDWKAVAESLEIGDILWVKHPGNHCLIYIGTLRDYGYTGEQLPAMADMLDYPLMIHCSRNPYCYFRFKNLLDSQQGGRLAEATPPDGGVSVCILGPEREDAEMQIRFLDGTDACFDVEGTCVTVFSFKNVTRYFFYRETVPAPAEEAVPTEETEESAPAEEAVPAEETEETAPMEEAAEEAASAEEAAPEDGEELPPEAAEECCPETT